MAAGHDHGNASRDPVEAGLDQRVAFGIGQHELLGVIRQNADAVDALVDHAIHDPTLPVEIEVTVARERRRRDRIDAGVGR